MAHFGEDQLATGIICLGEKNEAKTTHALNPVTRLTGTHPREVFADVLKGGFKGSQFALYEKIRAIQDINNWDTMR